MIKRLCGIFLLGFVLSACAFGDRTVTLQYPPQPEQGTAQAAVPLPSAALRSDAAPVIVGQFKDLRANKQKIGFVQNTYGMETANILAASSVTQWVRQSLVTELGLNGYGAKLGDAKMASADSVIVTGQIEKALTKAYFNYNSEIILSAELQKGNASLSNKTYVGRGGGGTNWAATETGFGRSIALALQDALRRLAADVGKAVITKNR